MRILFTFVGGNGHFQPLVPIAHAIQQKGHTITFACHIAMSAIVKQEGFPTLTFGTVTNAAPKKTDLLPLDREREDRDLRENFARRGARTRATNLESIIKEWKPEVIVCDETDFGTMIIAEYLDIPHVTVQVIASGSFIRPEVVAEALNEIRAGYNLEPDPALNMIGHYLYLSPVPPIFRHPEYPAPKTTHAIRPYENTEQSLYPLEKHNPELETIYFTLGTVFNMESGDLFLRVLDGLKTMPINLVVTVGKHIDPSEFGTQPDNVFITQYIPQLTLLPQVQLVVSHGGSGSVIATLAHGLPMVLIPMGADQPHNADRCEALGVAQILDPISTTPEEVRSAAATVLQTASYHENAKQIQNMIRALPEPTHAVTLIEQLGKTKQPIYS